MPNTEDTQHLFNIAEQLPEQERTFLYQKGFEDGQANRRSDVLEHYKGEYPLAASDVYLQGYTKGKEVALKRQEVA